MRPTTKALTTAAALALCGCVQVSKEAVTTKSASLIGIDISGPDSVASPHIRIGFMRVQAHSIPVSRNGEAPPVAPNFESFIQLHGSGSTTITEDVRSGECALVPSPVPFNQNTTPTP